MQNKRLILLLFCLFGLFIFYCLADAGRPLFLPQPRQNLPQARQSSKSSFKTDVLYSYPPLNHVVSFPVNASVYGNKITWNGLDARLPQGRIATRLAEFKLPDFGAGNEASPQAVLLPALKSIFQKEGIPHDLVWLAEVESLFDPNAESKAGAMGLFQLMPATAERFGLKIFPEDDRIMPDKNARAAAAYLRQLRAEFGCWSLALAAYNAGEGRVSRTMKLYQTKNFSELAPYLPAETRRYVPRVMTVMALREDQLRCVPAACAIP